MRVAQLLFVGAEGQVRGHVARERPVNRRYLADARDGAVRARALFEHEVARVVIKLAGVRVTAAAVAGDVRMVIDFVG